ncbi:MAG TPA: XRE family transcriptional regulator [Rhodospirillales bacterium]|nr:XRE family transcriptional regulator [Rhodospirillales bacterium]
MPTRPFGKDSVNARKPTLEQYIGDRIRRRRTQLGLTQEQLARTIGVSYQQIQKYETGANRIPAGSLHLIARRLDVSLDYFLAGFEEREADRGAGPGHGARDRSLIEIARHFSEVNDSGVKAALAALVKAVVERQAPVGRRRRRGAA